MENVKEAAKSISCVVCGKDIIEGQYYYNQGELLGNDLYDSQNYCSPDCLHEAAEVYEALANEQYDREINELKENRH